MGRARTGNDHPQARGADGGSRMIRRLSCPPSLTCVECGRFSREPLCDKCREADE